MLVHLLQPTSYHTRLRVWKDNYYQDRYGKLTTKEKAVPHGPARTLQDRHPPARSTDQLLREAVPDDEQREEFRREETKANRLHASGQSTKKEHTKPGTEAYTRERLELHHRIIAKLMGDVDAKMPPEGTPPTVVMIGGRSGSGKGSFEASLDTPPERAMYDKRTSVVLDPDVIKGMLPGWDPKLAAVFHDESADIFDKAVAEARKLGVNTVLDLTMSTDRVSTAKLFKRRGYKIEAHYMHRPVELAVVAAVNRYFAPSKALQLDGTTKYFPHGRIVPLHVVMKQTENEKFFDRLRRHVDTWTVWDNSEKQFNPKLVDSSDGRHLARKFNPFHDAVGRFTDKMSGFLGLKSKKKRHVEKWTFDTAHAQEGRVLNGVPLEVVPHPDFSESVNPKLKEPPMVVPGWKHVSAGVVVTEPDGRVWVVQPNNQFGGYKNTFPKGTVKPGESLQETAAREVWEESGLVVKITGHLIDVDRTTSVARFYTGRRVGGAPWAYGPETHAVKLVPIQGRGTDIDVRDVFDQPTSDQKVLHALRARKLDTVEILKFDPAQPRDKEGQWVKSGWYKSHGGHHVEVKGGKIVSGTHAGKQAVGKHFVAGPFKTHSEAKAHVVGTPIMPVTKPKVAPPPPPKIKPSVAMPGPKPPAGMLEARSKKIEQLLKDGTAPLHGVLNAKVDPEANAARIKALGKGPALARALKEYAETPTQDLDVITGIEVQDHPVHGQAHATWERVLVMGSTSVTGDFRHELGHTIHMSLSKTLQAHVEALHAESMAKAAKYPAGTKEKLSHEFYETTYGVIGRRALDSWHEDFAEHYRGYVKAVHQVKTGKDPGALATYTNRHPKWSKFWDAYYAGGAS